MEHSSDRPNWPYMMKVLAELWFREHGYNVEVTYETAEPLPQAE